MMSSLRPQFFQTCGAMNSLGNHSRLAVWSCAELEVFWYCARQETSDEFGSAIEKKLTLLGSLGEIRIVPEICTPGISRAGSLRFEHSSYHEDHDAHASRDRID